MAVGSYKGYHSVVMLLLRQGRYTYLFKNVKIILLDIIHIKNIPKYKKKTKIYGTDEGL